MHRILRLTVVPVLLLTFVLIVGRAADPTSAGALCGAWFVFNAAFAARTLPLRRDVATSLEIWRYLLVYAVLLFAPEISRAHLGGGEGSLWLLGLPAVVAAPVLFRTPGYSAIAMATVVLCSAGGLWIVDEPWSAAQATLVGGIIGITVHVLGHTIGDLDREQARRRDRARRLERLFGDYGRAIEHNVRAPLERIAARRGAGIPSEVAELVDDLVERLETLQDFAAIEEGTSLLCPESISPGGVAEAAVSTLAALGHRHGCELWALVDPDVPGRVVADGLRIGRVLSFFLRHAIEHTASGAVAVHVSCRERADGRARLRYEIRDSGIGLNESFDGQRLPFAPTAEHPAQLRAVSLDAGGHDRGLRLCRGLVDQMQGQIGLDDQPDRGLTLSFTAWVELKPGTNAPAWDSGLAGLRALVVMDDGVGRTMLERQLDVLRLAVDSADGPRAALDRLHEAHAANEPFDLLVVDESAECGLDSDATPVTESLIGATGNAEGFADIELCLRSRPEFASLPILKLLSRINSNVGGRAAQTIQKPVRPSTLPEQIARAVSEARRAG